MGSRENSGEEKRVMDGGGEQLSDSLEASEERRK